MAKMSTKRAGIVVISMVLLQAAFVLQADAFISGIINSFSCDRGDGNGRPGDGCAAWCKCRSPNTCQAGTQTCVAPRRLRESCHATAPCDRGLSCHPGIHQCYNSPRREGEPCSLGFSCGRGLTCQAGSQKCVAPRQLRESCHATAPCDDGLSCQPGVHQCYNSPRREGEPCSLGFSCGQGLTCEAGSQTCVAPRQLRESCHATAPCDDGLSCQPGVHQCFHSPRLAGEPCSLGFSCGGDLSCAATIQQCVSRGDERCSDGKTVRERIEAVLESLSPDRVDSLLTLGVDMKARPACASLQAVFGSILDQLLDCDTAGPALTFYMGVGVDATAGVVTGGGSVGYYFDTRGNEGCYASACGGAGIGLGGGSSVIVGALFGGADNVAGPSAFVNGDVRLGGGFGLASGATISDPPIAFVEISPGVGAELSFTAGGCYTEVWE